MATYTNPQYYSEQWSRDHGYTGAFGEGGATKYLQDNNLLGAYEADKTKYGQTDTSFLAPGVQPLTTASLTETQKNALYGLAQPLAPTDPRASQYLDTAAQTLGKAATPYDVNSYKSFLNPFEDQVVASTVGDITKSYDQRRSTLNDQLASNGSFGSTAQGVEQAALTEAQANDIARTTGQLRAQGFDSAVNNSMNLYTGDRNAAMNTASGYQNLGNAATELDRYNTNKGLTGLNSALTAGDRIQGQNQSELDALYAERDRAAAYPQQMLNFLTGQYQAFPTMQSETTTSKGGGSGLSNLAGLAMMAGSAYATGGASLAMPGAMGATIGASKTADLWKPTYGPTQLPW